ncbi:hypothetical protein [Allorhodopirellula solitaria]|uniref:hypothetical protein n=1 Tax=Allorhodopirellula solitaria TaxID=2527987 RepID=UPI001C9595D4|nr:hypothetical protein [Allorhodopirellula solitaria]
MNGTVPSGKRSGCFWLFLIGPLALIAILVIAGKPQSGTAKTAAEAPMDLPADATDITYYLGNAWPLRCYDFQTSEAAFLQWASDSSMVPAGRSGHQIVAPVLGPSGEIQFEPIPPGNYIYFSWSEDDRGEHAAYDTETGHAYYLAHSR